MRSKPILAFMIKNVKLTFRSKVDLFWIFAWPVIWLLLTAYIFIPPTIDQPINLRLGIVNHDIGSIHPFNGSLLVEIINHTEHRGSRIFQVHIYPNEDLMIDDLKGGKLDCGLVIPERFGEKALYSRSEIDVYIGARSIQSAQVARSILRELIEELNIEISYQRINESLKYIRMYYGEIGRGNIDIVQGGDRDWIEFIRDWLIGVASPINATFKEVKPSSLMTRDLTLGWYTFGAIGLSILYSGLIIGSLMAVEEREQGTLKRLLSSPASSTDMLLGKTLAGLIILGFMAIIIILVGVFLLGARINWSPLNLENWIALIVIVMLSLIMIGFGMILSLIARTSRSAVNLSIVLGLMLAFTAGIWLPIEWMPKPIQVLAEIFPATWAVDLIRSVMVFEAKIDEITIGFFQVAAATIAIYVIGIVAYRKALKKYAED
ncbi:MAG: ABC transporter permease [Candidatus Caldarchaeales archaeon]